MLRAKIRKTRNLYFLTLSLDSVVTSALGEVLLLVL